MKQPCCETCRFSRHGLISHDDGSTTPICFCHRYAPKPNRDRMSRALPASWPEVKTHDWCGEWEA